MMSFLQFNYMPIYDIARTNKFIEKMLQAPRRQRIINLPKDGSRAGFFSQRNSSKHSTNSLNSAHMQFSFNLNDLEQRTQQQINLSNEIDHRPSPKRTIDSLYTVNPQKTKFKNIGSIMSHQDIKNKQSPRKQQQVLSVLQGPLVEDMTGQQLVERMDSSFEMNGNIRKISLIQKPLQQQNQFQVTSPPKKMGPFDKIQQSDRKISQFKKNDSISFCKDKSKILPNLSRMGVSQPESLMRLAKKQSEIETPLSNLQMVMKKQTTQHKKPLLQYGYLLPQNKLSKLKAEINSITSHNKKNKPKINYTNETRIEDDIQIEQDQNQGSSKYKFGQNIHFKNSFFESSRNWNTNNQIYEQGYDQHGLQDRNSEYRSFSNPKAPNHHRQPKKITISYKTSMNQLKQIFNKILHMQNTDIQILVPKILMTTYFQQNMEKTDLHNHAKYIFTTLGIPSTNLTIKKYSNCILMVAKNVCLLWHYDGKVYLGGWQIQYLDQGVKHGLGLQWVPNKYVYYGEYSQSKKSGLGILKTRQQTYIGEWIQNKRTDNGHIINQNGEILHPRISYDGRNKHRLGQQYLQTDPFM